MGVAADPPCPTAISNKKRSTFLVLSYDLFEDNSCEIRLLSPYDSDKMISIYDLDILKLLTK